MEIFLSVQLANKRGFKQKTNSDNSAEINQVLMMVHTAQNDWVCGICPSSGVLNTLKTPRSGKVGLCLQVRIGDTYSIGS
jgi:hypothetical protein